MPYSPKLCQHDLCSRCWFYPWNKFQLRLREEKEQLKAKLAQPPVEVPGPQKCKAHLQIRGTSFKKKDVIIVSQPTLYCQSTAGRPVTPMPIYPCMADMSKKTK